MTLSMNEQLFLEPSKIMYLIFLEKMVKMLGFDPLRPDSLPSLIREVLTWHVTLPEHTRISLKLKVISYIKQLLVDFGLT